MRLASPWLTLLVAAGCNQDDLFLVSGYQQEAFSNKADILFVIDNSTSMVEEASSLALNFNAFVEDLSEAQAELGTNGLADAVTNYVDYVQDPAAFLDYQLAITTTDAEGLAGGLIGEVIPRGDSGVASQFIQGLLCEATCFTDVSSIGNDPSYLCSDPPPEEVHRQWLECVCGSVDNWLGNCGSAREEPLEAVFLAMCRAVENPPEACFEDIEVNGEVIPAALQRGDRGSNAGLLRDGAAFMPVLVTDEGDDSRRESEQGPIPQEYLDLFGQFRRRITWVVVGPQLEAAEELACPGPATTWGTYRFEYLVYDSNGLKVPITDEQCGPADFKAALESLGVLLQTLGARFPLESVPVVETLQVTIDGKSIPEARETGEDAIGLPQFSDGWTYRAEDNSIQFHGSAIPSSDADVRVYYLPLDGMPRELPF